MQVIFLLAAEGIALCSTVFRKLLQHLDRMEWGSGSLRRGGEDGGGADVPPSGFNALSATRDVVDSAVLLLLARTVAGQAFARYIQRFGSWGGSFQDNRESCPEVIASASPSRVYSTERERAIAGLIAMRLP